jgi:hypothetical protein
MKYFANIPSKPFESTIGTFSISDFFTYIDPNLANISVSPVTIDTKSTLLEKAYTVYSDINSFWMFVLANKTINPFTLPVPNTTIYIEENEVKTTLKITDSPTGATAFTFPKGSIIAPYVLNTGGSYSYKSVGNFDLNGPLSIIESVHYYKDTMIIKDQRGATYSFILQDGLTGSNIVIISPTSGGTYTIQKQFYPTNSKSATKEVVKVELSEEGKIEELVSSRKTKTSSTKSTTTTTTTSSTPIDVTEVQVVEQQSKNINAYLPEQIGVLKGLYVTTKYS